MFNIYDYTEAAKYIGIIFMLFVLIILISIVFVDVRKNAKRIINILSTVVDIDDNVYNMLKLYSVNEDLKILNNEIYKKSSYTRYLPDSWCWIESSDGTGYLLDNNGNYYFDYEINQEEIEYWDLNRDHCFYSEGGLNEYKKFAEKQIIEKLFCGFDINAFFDETKKIYVHCKNYDEAQHFLHFINRYSGYCYTVGNRIILFVDFVDDIDNCYCFIKGEGVEGIVVADYKAHSDAIEWCEYKEKIANRFFECMDDTKVRVPSIIQGCYWIHYNDGTGSLYNEVSKEVAKYDLIGKSYNGICLDNDEASLIKSVDDFVYYIEDKIIKKGDFNI